MCVQCLPVVRGRGNIEDACHTHSPLWRHVQLLSLHENMRIQRCLAVDPAAAARLLAWNDYLLRLGDGTLGEPALDVKGNELDGVRRVALLPSLLFKGTLSEFLATVYPDLEARAFHVHAQASDSNVKAWIEYLRGRAILAPLNVDVGSLNDALLALFPGRAVELLSVDTCRDDTNHVRCSPPPALVQPPPCRRCSATTVPPSRVPPSRMPSHLAGVAFGDHQQV